MTTTVQDVRHLSERTDAVRQMLNKKLAKKEKTRAVLFQFVCSEPHVIYDGLSTKEYQNIGSWGRGRFPSLPHAFSAYAAGSIFQTRYRLSHTR